ncbi:3-deoxy-D-manno-octulosonic acid transferase [Lewinella sp. IMCC34191]|uniref:3-deoxy-D-manno-octulosonic acid transferase n=1 Tax=Lewinella sp. IMCC34191 TaxID=2259172 RepID=UPI000E22FB0A|nr:glycosyltransferase N-terminal domain-containing protein [Lewinella sp. IMCC34191]
MRWLYRTGVGAYHLGIQLAARVGNDRAQKWIAGRREQPVQEIGQLHRQGRPILWLHAASLGEFEQGRPILTELRKQHPNWAVVVTFFSPSGYDRCRQTELAEVVAYLPRDNKEAAQSWIALLQPKLAVFVKYEFWYHHLNALRSASVPTFLIAGSFRPDQPFFKWYGSVWREMLQCFTYFAVQTQADKALLKSLSLTNICVTGDPRLDRTADLAEAPFHDERLADFCDRQTLFAGSVWPPDVKLLAEVWPRFEDRWKLVLAPHQLKKDELEEWQRLFAAERYTESPENKRVLLLDTIGILSRAYRYGSAAYVGGAFGSGLHNTLEPLSYGLPVIFGPRYHKFPEADAARKKGGAFSVETPQELEKVWQQLSDSSARAAATQAQLAYRDLHRGAGKRTATLISKLLLFLILLLPLYSPAQSWSASDRVVGTLDGVFGKCNLMVALSGKEWRPGLCMAAAELEPGASISLALYLEADTDYIFIASAETKRNDLDLYLRNGQDSLLLEDDKADGTPIMEFSPEFDGNYVIQLHLPSGKSPNTFVGLGILSSRGVPFTDLEYRKVSTQFGAAAGAVHAAGGAQRFGGGQNGWCVYGYILGEGEGATLDNLSLPLGQNFLAATGSDVVRDLDIFLADEEMRILRRDRDPDPYPMIEYDSQAPGPYILRVEVEKATDTGLILLGLFTR